MPASLAILVVDLLDRLVLPVALGPYQILPPLAPDEYAAAHQIRDRAPLTAAQVVGYLQDLPRLWADGRPAQRRQLAETLFARIRALGITRMEIEPTEIAVEHGIADAFGADEVVMVGARGVRPRLTRSSGIWIPRLYRGRVLVTMGGARPPLRSVRSP